MFEGNLIHIIVMNLDDCSVLLYVYSKSICFQLKESEKQIKQKDEKYNKTNEKLKEVNRCIFVAFWFGLICEIVPTDELTIEFYNQQTNKELQEKSGEIKTLKSQIHGLTEQVSHLEANKAQVRSGENKQRTDKFIFPSHCDLKRKWFLHVLRVYFFYYS